MKSNVWKRAGKLAALAVLFLLVSGCAIAARSDKFGADWDLELGLGGIIAQAVDIKFILKGQVGFGKTCVDPKKSSEDGQNQQKEAHDAAAELVDPRYDDDTFGLDHFL